MSTDTLTPLTPADVAGALRAAIAATPCPVGQWAVDDLGDRVVLVWSADEADWPADAYGDEPWTDWGGNAMKEGLPEPDDAGSDEGQDRFGRPITRQWAGWSFPILVSDRDWEVLMAALDDPGEPNEALKAAMSALDEHDARAAFERGRKALDD